MGDIAQGIQHIRDKVGDRKKAKLDDLERKAGRLTDKLGRLGDTNGEIGGNIDKKQEEVGKKPASELDVGECEKHLRDLKAIGSSLDRAEGERDRNSDEYEKLLKEFNALRDDIVKELKDEIESKAEEDTGLQKGTDENLGKADGLLDELDKKLTDASNGITDPDKMAALSRVKKKLADARKTKDGLGDDNGENRDGLNGVKEQYNAIKPEDDPISALGDTDQALSPVDTKTKETAKAAEDLLAGIADIDAELDDFNKNAR